MGFSAEFERIGHRIAESIVGHVVAVQLVGQLNLAAFEFLAFQVVFLLGHRTIQQQVHQLVELTLYPFAFALELLNLAFMEYLLGLTRLARISDHILE